ncbi:MAG: NAD-dependent epimerase/dehydratase family protein, partial [Acetobacteraceae bacterium]|nr:NAD-dependent epimerase/dehydratase family protein [Acetobacteraceae bacterium]
MTALAPNLAGRKVVVTGGAGFVGSHTVDLLAGSGCQEIVIIDDMVRGRPENLRAVQANRAVRLIEGDICDRALMRDLVPGADVVFHLAALRITQCAAEPRR